jgi:Holliday junction DNA helicase RuvB
LLDVDELGLDAADRRLLEFIAVKFENSPVGIKTLAAAIQEDAHTLEEVVEPFLLQLGFLDRTPQGRKVTQKGLLHLGLQPKGML